ncbi:hypothetical protein HPP92_011733 [Vanilla planifolia]|uniref:RRP12-like protein n=1 Tax=Vanilla planifolia TaxID=51239 RepID=A0A835R3C5_VANPL|nr:hypothetical protein HPP92_011733 [Vanilla planifolia]
MRQLDHNGKTGRKRPPYGITDRRNSNNVAFGSFTVVTFTGLAKTDVINCPFFSSEYSTERNVPVAEVMRSKSEAEHSSHDEEVYQELRGVYASSEKRTKMKNVVTDYNAHGGSTIAVGEDKEENEVEEHEPILKPGSDGDICHSVMERYARSLAPQHRHLCATASAMRSILSEEGLPLSPPAYFAAAITAIRDLDPADLEGIAALSAFVAIVLPLVPADSLPKTKAKDAAFILISFIRDNASALPTGSLRSMVKSLGSLTLLLDLEDWPSVELPLETLVFFALDRRPKVRRCAQSCLEMIFKNHPKSPSIKRAGKFILSIYQKHISLVKKPDSTEPTVILNGTETATGHMEVLHMLNFLNILIPYLSAKVRLKILCDVYKLLGYHFSWSTRHILRLLLVLLELSKVKAIVAEAESIMSALALYTSAAEKNPIDTIITSSTISNYVLKKLRDACPGLWTRYLPLLFTSLIGYLKVESETSRQLARIMKELIEIHIGQSPFRNANQSVNYDMSTNEATAVASFEQCIGAAVVAMGPEKLLSLLPIAFDMDKLTCSNTWIIPILRKHVICASLQFFMDNVVPLAQSLQEACKSVKEECALNNLQSCFHSLWDLLPAFCSYPSDTEKIEAFSMWLMVVLKEEPSLHEIIALALKVLIYSNRDDRRQCMEEPNSILFNQFSMDLKIFHYSKKTASRNMKALATRSTEFFQILKDIFFDSSEKRVCIKDALGCLGFILPSEYIRSFLLSSMESVKQLGNLIESGSFDDNVQEKNKEVGHDKAARKNEEKRCLLMELASSFVEAADADLTYTIFDITKSSLSESNGMCQREGYYTLTSILKEKEWFCSVQLDELLDVLFAVKPPTDKIILKHRFSCFNYLLTNMLKSNGDDVNMKAFLILNEIITTLKSKKESRKLAYDALLNITGRLKNSQSDIMDSDLMRLFNMVLGYLSCSSPHIMSGAVSALSLLIHHDATFCLSVPNLIPSVLSLLQKKATEVVKATLGFIKVLVSSLNCKDLISLLPDIIDGILPWSSVSKHHFRSKVGLILEILIRKCTFEAVENQASGKYKGFVKSIKEGRLNKKKRKGDDNADIPHRSSHSTSNRGKKRLHNDVSTPFKKGSVEDSNSHNKNTVKRLQNGFSKNNSTGKGACNRFKHQSTTSACQSSQKHIKQQQRSTGNHSKRRNGEKQKTSSRISARRNVTKHKGTANGPKPADSLKFNKHKKKGKAVLKEESFYKQRKAST